MTDPSDPIELPLDDESDLAFELEAAREDGEVLNVLQETDRPVAAFDFVASAIHEEWRYSPRTDEQRSDLVREIEALIQWFSGREPDNPVLWYWRLIHSWMNENYDTFLYLDGQVDTVPNVLFGRFFPEEIADYRIRSLLRVGRTVGRRCLDPQGSTS